MTLDEAREHIGRAVIYRSPGRPPEDGVITRVGSTLVFVRYAGDLASKGTYAQNLELSGVPR